MYQETNINRENTCPHEVVTKNHSEGIFYYFLMNHWLSEEAKRPLILKCKLTA